jgi:hypothetical protein
MGYETMTDPDARFAIIPLEPGPAPSEAIVIGSMNQVMEYIPQSRARDEAMAEFERARASADQIKQMQAATTKMQVAAFADAIDQLERRLITKEAEHEAQARRDAEEAERREAERIAAHLDALPDPDDPDTWGGPSRGGELSPIRPSHPEDKEQLAASDQGDLPEELLEKTPPPSGTAPTIGFTDARRARARPYKTAPQTYPQVAVSLNEE